jgi:PBP1b-binding outer membrane lipoprotein LpoB
MRGAFSLGKETQSMKPRLAALGLALMLAGCSAMNTELGSMSPKAGAVAVKLTDAAKHACTKQAVFNTVAGAAGVFSPKVADAAALASMAVGMGCVWANS